MKGPFQHTKDLCDHFLISESYSKKGVLTVRQMQILGFYLFKTETVNQNGTKYVLQEALQGEQCAMSQLVFTDAKSDHF